MEIAGTRRFQRSPDRKVQATRIGVKTRVQRPLQPGCVKSTCRLAYWYLIPVIDMGFVITSEQGTITGLYGRVTTMVPGSGCLICRGRVDPGVARAEVLDPDERRRLADEGYVPDLGDPDPPVVVYTTMVASVAVSELLERLIGFGVGEPPNELLLRVHERRVSPDRWRRAPRSLLLGPAFLGSR